ncbi:MAG: aldehyde dehydrogenase family protein [Pseudobdellovibrionaceae bacterium]
MTILDFVQSLQEMKKAQIQWAGLELQTRSQALNSIAQMIGEKSADISKQLSDLQFLPPDFILQNEVLAAQTIFSHVSQIQPSHGLLPKATGFISILLPELFAFRVLAEKLAPALLAGNGIFIYVPSHQSVLKKIWQEILDPAWPIRIFDGADDLAEIMISHPGIHAVSSYGSPDQGEKVLKALAGSWKKSQITAGYHNSALIMNDVDVSKVAKSLVQSCFTGFGQLHWNISNILVTESQLPAFLKEFLGAIEASPVSEMSPSAQKRLQDIKAKLKSENGKALYGADTNGPLVVQDLSHCSTLQQDCLMAPVVLISPVKYVHEMVRWTNTSYYGMLAQIFGAEEKILKFAGQLEVSRILANGWIEKMSELPLGMKQSFSGLSDVNPFGGFYSDLRKIDGLESKN